MRLTVVLFFILIAECEGRENRRPLEHGVSSIYAPILVERERICDIFVYIYIYMEYKL
jgi:hypothetical protein